MELTKSFVGKAVESTTFQFTSWFGLKAYLNCFRSVINCCIFYYVRRQIKKVIRLFPLYLIFLLMTFCK